MPASLRPIFDPARRQAGNVLVLKELRTIQKLMQKVVGLEARIIAAANTDLYKDIEAGSFRSDLYYRLGVLEIIVPPLRDRPGDIEILTRWLISRGAGKMDRRVLIPFVRIGEKRQNQNAFRECG